MWINNFWENWTNKKTGKKNLINDFFLHNDVSSEVEENIWNVSKIIQFRWDTCPNCDSSNYRNDKCEDCLYWFWDDFVNFLENKEEEKNIKRQNLSEKMSWIWKKMELRTRNGRKFFYFNYPNRVKNWKWIFEIEFEWKKYLITASFYTTTNNHFQDKENVYSYSKINLEEPENFDWRHYILDSKTKRWVYFDFQIAKEILDSILKNFFIS